MSGADISMERRNTRARRTANVMAPELSSGSTPQRNVTINRPSINTTLSKAYGAPGRTKLPVQMTTKPRQDMLAAMKDMMEQDNSDDVSDEEQSEDEPSENEPSTDDDQEQDSAVEEETEEDTQKRDKGQKMEVEGDDPAELQSRQSRPDPTITSSPLQAISKKIKGLWRSPNEQISGNNFMTEDKIASEARIVRPREPLARKLLRWREKLIRLFTEYGGSRLLSSLILLLKLFTGALFVLFALQSLKGFLPDDMSISEPLYEIKEGLTSPVISILDKISSLRTNNTGILPPELDLSQLKTLRDSTAVQFKHLKSRLDNMESTYNRLARKVNTPVIPERKINLFSPGSGLVVDPYMSSPTLARDLAKKNLVTKWFSLWRTYPPSVHHGPISAFTPWEDMGDCWCSPDSEGRAQLVVDLGRSVIPKELIVEHMFKDATLHIGSAPKDIELWIKISDKNQRNAVIKGALDYDIDQNIDGSVETHLRSLDQTWVRIGRWQYDVNGSSNIQSFIIQVPLEEFKAQITRLAFRSTSNWGPGKNVCIYRLKLHGTVITSDHSRQRTTGY